MGHGAREILIVKNSLEKGQPRKLVSTFVSFNSYKEFIDYHKGYFSDSKCVESFAEEFGDM